jgi:hypothetical protein
MTDPNSGTAQDDSITAASATASLQGAAVTREKPRTGLSNTAVQCIKSRSCKKNTFMDPSSHEIYAAKVLCIINLTWI